MAGGTGTAAGGRWPAVRWVAGRWLRRRLVGVLPLFAVVLVGTAATIVALDAAQRTSSAFDRYLERANVGDVVVNPTISNVAIDRVIRSLPGITEVTTESLFMVTRDDGAPRARRQVDEGRVEGGAMAGVFGSPDGRYASMDRPVVTAGRLPTGPAEIALSASAAEAEDVELGDVIPLAFWQPGLEDVLSPEELRRRANELVEPVGVEHLTVVGLLVLPDEVLPNELYSRARAIVSPDVARRYDCLAPPPDPGRSYAENVALNHPPDCAASYRYYSLSFAAGAAGVKPALEELLRRVGPLNAELAKLVDPSGAAVTPLEYFVLAKETEPERQRIERATRPTVAALGVLGAAAGAMTLALAGLLVAREVRRARAAQQQWRHLGMTRGERTAVAAAPTLVAIGLGVLGGTVASALLRVGPIGVVEVLEPRLPRGFEPLDALAAVAIGLGCSTIAVIVAGRASGAAAEVGMPDGAGRIGHRLPVVGSPPVAEGIRAAYGTRTAGPVIAGTGLVAVALTAALVFGANLSGLVEAPRSYGWPWDLAALTGGGYGDLDLEAATAAFDTDPAVATWTAFGFLNEASLEGEPTMSVVGVERETPAVDFPLLAGSLPTRPDEIALGVNTAGERGIGVGDTVQLGGPFESFDVTVTGLVVFPAAGPMFAESVGAGTGMLLPQVLVDAVAPFPNAATGLATFVGVELADDADDVAIARVRDRLAGLDALGNSPIRFDTPVRPPEVVEAAATRSVPVTVGVALAAMGALGLGMASWASVRIRRRDLAILRSLGFSRRQIRSTIRIQMLATTAAAVAIGVPLGVLVGRLSWRTFARQLGVLPDTTSGWSTIGAVIVGALVLALVAAQVPARRAAMARPADGLRTE